MGTPNSLEILFGDFTTDVERLSEEDRWGLFERVLGKCRQQLKYMQGFRPIRLEQLHMYIPESADSNHAILGMYGLHLAGLDQQHQGPEWSEQKHYSNLFLTRDGKLLNVSQKMEKYWFEDYPGHQDFNWRVTSWDFRYVEKPGDHGLVFTPWVVLCAVRSIRDALNETKRERQKHLTSMGRLADDVSTVVGRLRFLEEEKEE